jgi:hypothetical protein
MSLSNPTMFMLAVAAGGSWQTTAAHRTDLTRQNNLDNLKKELLKELAKIAAGEE